VCVGADALTADCVKDRSLRGVWARAGPSGPGASVPEIEGVNKRSLSPVVLETLIRLATPYHDNVVRISLVSARESVIPVITCLCNMHLLLFVCGAWQMVPVWWFTLFTFSSSPKAVSCFLASPIT